MKAYVEVICLAISLVSTLSLVSGITAVNILFNAVLPPKNFSSPPPGFVNNGYPPVNFTPGENGITPFWHFGYMRASLSEPAWL